VYLAAAWALSFAAPALIGDRVWPVLAATVAAMVASTWWQTHQWLRAHRSGPVPADAEERFSQLCAQLGTSARLSVPVAAPDAASCLPVPGVAVVAVHPGLVDRGDEFDGACAHELAHVRLGHWKRPVAVSAALVLVWGSSWWWSSVTPGSWPRAGIASLSAAATVALVLVAAWWSRRDEFAADECAARVVGADAVMVSLTGSGVVDRSASWWASHPPTSERTARLAAFERAAR
jgi:Zn-dependent protease with chaperone function